MSGPTDHRATIVHNGIRMKIRRTSHHTTGTGSRRLPVDDVINGGGSSPSKASTATVALQNGSIDAHAPRTTGSRLPKRKRPHLNCVVDTESRDNRTGSSAISTNGSDSGTSGNGCLDSAAGQSHSSSSSSALSVDGITLNNEQSNSNTATPYQVFIFNCLLFNYLLIMYLEQCAPTCHASARTLYSLCLFSSALLSKLCCSVVKTLSRINDTFMWGGGLT